MNVVINYWAVLASAVASMVIGSIWFGPLFGKMYISLMGMDKKTPEEQAAMSAGGGSASGGKKGMAMTYVWQFIASLVMFYVLAHVTELSQNFFHYSNVKTGLTTAFWVWLGFIVPVMLGGALWGGKMKLFWLGIGNMLVTLLVGGLIIGMMK